jgi:hypothetical protein
MDTLNNDATNIIYKQIYAIDQLQLYKVFNQPRPTQFRASRFKGTTGIQRTYDARDHD